MMINFILDIIISYLLTRSSKNKMSHRVFTVMLLIFLLVAAVTTIVSKSVV
jgi:hypothetical protein